MDNKNNVEDADRFYASRNEAWRKWDEEYEDYRLPKRHLGERGIFTDGYDAGYHDAQSAIGIEKK